MNRSGRAPKGVVGRDGQERKGAQGCCWERRTGEEGRPRVLLGETNRSGRAHKDVAGRDEQERKGVVGIAGNKGLLNGKANVRRIGTNYQSFVEL
jgi:hypothetical protein